jgi:hypothetical protein
MASRIARHSIQAAVLALGLALAAPAAATEYDSERAGHPLRILAYIGHPIGVLLDYALLRPCHWVGSQEPFSTIFGHTEDGW